MGGQMMFESFSLCLQILPMKGLNIANLTYGPATVQ